MSETGEVLGSTRRAETGLAAGVKAGRLFLRAAGSVANQIRWPHFVAGRNSRSPDFARGAILPDPILRAAGSVGDALRWPEIEINSATDCQPRRGPKTGFDQSRKMARIVVMWVDRVGRLWDHQIVE